MLRNFRSSLSKAALAAAFAVLAAGPVLADEPDSYLLSYEATPSAGFDLPKLEAAGYDERAAFAAKVLAEIVPKIADAVGIDANDLDTEVTPGGYLLKTNASLQTEAEISSAEADRFAAGLGYVFRQYSVLVSGLDDASAKTGYVVVTFPDNTLNATVAQAFFEKAAAVDKGLGGGYTAFGDDQIFLNVVGDDGKPYSGLDNATFLAGLTKAAAEFGPPQPKVSDSGTATARFIGNEWDKQPKGEAYIEKLGGASSDTVKALDVIEADYAKLVEAAFK
mgnify:CR=1 FL=1